MYKTYIVGGNANLTKTITGLKKGTTYKCRFVHIRRWMELEFLFRLGPGRKM